MGVIWMRRPADNLAQTDVLPDAEDGAGMNLKRMAAAAALALALAVALGEPAAHASNLETVVTFDWVSTSYTTADTHPVTPSGSLTLTLPGTITTQTFDTGNLGAAAITDITAFSYTFSDGLSVGLSDLTSPVS